MKFFALILLISAWGCLFFAPSSTGSRVLQLIFFGLFGALCVIAGGFQYWWNSSMLPSEKSAFILICGLGTLASQLGSIIQGVLGNEGGTDWPESQSRRPPKR